MPGTIVVGVDGSEPSLAALRFGAEEAELRGARLVAVHAWVFTSPGPLAEPGLAAPITAIDLPGQLAAQRETAEEELDAALADVFPSGAPDEVERKLVEQDPRRALEHESKTADLMVVGSRGRSGITAALLGSVSRHVVDHAVCPVVVVKGPRTGD
jgi:nucleotide-binding universal stress UspA family protein